MVDIDQLPQNRGGESSGGQREAQAQAAPVAKFPMKAFRAKPQRPASHFESECFESAAEFGFFFEDSRFYRQRSVADGGCAFAPEHAAWMNLFGLDPLGNFRGNRFGFEKAARVRKHEGIAADGL